MMYGYVAISYGSYFYYFGGFCGLGCETLNSILGLQKFSWTWSHHGKMKATREGHAVIMFGDRFMIIGGIGYKKNEACLLKNGEFDCTAFTTSLTNYANMPILYLVEKYYENC